MTFLLPTPITLTISCIAPISGGKLGFVSNMLCEISISITLSSKSPFLSFVLIFSRLFLYSSCFSSLMPLGKGGRSFSKILFSINSSILSLFFSLCSFFTKFKAAFARSLTMLSTSRPTKPTSVYLLASILIKGKPIILAKRLAISVLPTPVDPIIRIFFGTISSWSSGLSCILR